VRRGYKDAFKIDAASYICEAAAGAVTRNQVIPSEHESDERLRKSPGAR